MNQQNTLYIVVPCYNEEAVLPETAKRLAKEHKLRAQTDDKYAKEEYKKDMSREVLYAETDKKMK